MKRNLMLLGAFFLSTSAAGLPPGAGRLNPGTGATVGTRLDAPGATCATASPRFGFAAEANAAHATCWQYDLGYKGLDQWYLQVVKTLHAPCQPGFPDTTCRAPFYDRSFVRMCVARWHPLQEREGLPPVLPGHAPQPGVEAPCAGRDPGKPNVTGKNGCAVCAEQAVPHGT